jgi:hypothetical protein
MSPLDNPSGISRAISSCRGLSCTRRSGEEYFVGELAAMIVDVSYISIPCPLRSCPHFVHSI